MTWWPAQEIESADIATWRYTEKDKHFWPPEELTRDKEIKLIVDVGANVGFSTGFLADGWPEAKVVGFEMDPVTVELANRYLANLRDRVTIFTAALGWPEREEQAVITSA